jgi:hypothetical protein
MPSQPAAVEAIFRFNTPDSDITANDRALFAIAAPKTVKELKLPLHDIRTASHLPAAPECLEKHGFAMVTHKSPESAWSDTEAVEKTYIPAISDLVKSLTGCKTVLVNNVAFRRKPVNMQADPMFYHKPGGDFDKMGRSMPTDRPFGKRFQAHN